MKREKSIKLKQTESLLKEMIPAALSTFDDSRINSINITEVDCSRGKYDADVYYYLPFLDAKDIRTIDSLLQKVSNKISNITLANTGWYRSPKLHFKYDKKVDDINRVEELFKRIKSE